MMRRAGLIDVRLNVVQPAFMDGDAKRIHVITLENIFDPTIAAGLATEVELRSLGARLTRFVDDADTIVSFPRIFQVVGRVPPAHTV